MTDNNFEPWPDDWPEYYNGNEPCDMKIGPCACGAWHQSGEFRFMGYVLFRYDKPIVTGDNVVYLTLLPSVVYL